MFIVETKVLICPDLSSLSYDMSCTWGLKLWILYYVQQLGHLTFLTHD
jgi:hypothetical protein